MIRLLLTTTALAGLLTTGVIAQQAPANNTMAPGNTTGTPAEVIIVAPTDNTMAPGDNTMAPGGNMMAPADNTMTPANTMTMTPGNNMMAPGGTSTMPAGTGDIVMTEAYSAMQGDLLGSRIMGSTVYTSTGDDAETIGDINDIVVGTSGNVAAVVIGVGGFLGIGEKNVAVNFNELQWTQAADGTWRYVLNTTADALNAAQEFIYEDENTLDAPGANNATNNAIVDGNANMAQNNAAGNTMMAPGTGMAPGNTIIAPTNTMAETAVATPFDRTTMVDVDETTMTADDLEDTAVYGVNDEQIGEIGDFVLNEQGGIDAVIIDVGGFLGLGQKEVAVAFDNLNFSADQNGNRYLFLNTTEDILEEQPEFNRDTYAAERDTQRMMINP